MKQKKILKTPIFWAVYGGVIAVAILLDQLSKHFVEIAVKSNGGRINIIGDWLTLVWTINTGATGGLFSGLAWRNWLFFFMTVLGLPVFGYLLWRSRTRSVWGQVAFSFIIGGTIGNAIDRLVFAERGFFTGGVRDFVCVDGFFGIFNVADSFLVVGVIMAVLAITFFDNDSLVATIKEERLAKIAQANADQSADEQSHEQVTEDENNPTY